jgi:sugar lactone lactonase YvrE
MKTMLDNDGWPIGAPELFVDLSPNNPDGSVVDANRNLWNAQWGAGRVACYNEHAMQIDELKFDTPQISCPSFGGEGLQTLFATSAAIDLALSEGSDAGKTFAVKTKTLGQAEHKVKIG